MKIKLKIWFIIIIILLFISSLICIYLNINWDKFDLKENEYYLEQKYDKEFEMVEIGEKLNKEYTQYYYRPKDNSSNIFEVISNINDINDIYDNYIKCGIEKKLEEDIISEMNKSSIDVECFSVMYVRGYYEKEKNINISIEEFTKKYFVDKVLIYLAYNTETVDDTYIDMFYSTLKLIGLKYCFDLDFKCFELSAENLHKIKEDKRNILEIKESTLKRTYESIKDFEVEVKNKMLDTTQGQ